MEVLNLGVQSSVAKASSSVERRARQAGVGGAEQGGGSGGTGALGCVPLTEARRCVCFGELSFFFFVCATILITWLHEGRRKLYFSRFI